MSKRQSSSEYLPAKSSSFKKHASKIFQESSVGMVSSIAQTSSKRRKIFKVLALIFCLTGFLYQGGVFLNHVFHYPTTVDIDIVRPPYFDLPAYTFCENNGINRRIFCEKYPDRCEVPNDAFCKKYEYYCGKNKTPVPKKNYYNFSYNKSLEELVELNMKWNDFLEFKDYDDDDYEINENITGPLLRKSDIWGPGYICYSLNDRVNNSFLPVKTPRSILVKPAVNTFQFIIQPNEMFLPGSRAGLLFAIHSPFQAVNPFEKGIFMKPGRTYLIYISLEEELLLQKPYPTDCLNYTEIWEKRGRAGPRSQEMCLHECIADISVRCFNCVLPGLLFPTQEKLCPPDTDLDPSKCKSDVSEPFLQCQSKCRDDCLKTKYLYTVQERFTPFFDENGTTLDNIDNIIIAEIYIEDEEVIVLKHSPKYLSVEAFSTIGGFIGIWLGISLLDITDILEGFYRIFRHPFKRRIDYNS